VEEDGCFHGTKTWKPYKRLDKRKLCTKWQRNIVLIMLLLVTGRRNEIK